MDNSPQSNVWKQYIEPFRPNFEKLFGQLLWKKAFLPWLKAVREIQIRTILNSKDHSETDKAKGFVLAIEMIMNLPGAMEAMKAMGQQEQPQQQAITDYAEGLAFDDDEM